MKMRHWLLLLLAFLRPAVDADPDPEPDPDQDADPDPQPELDLDPADPDPEPLVEPKEELEIARREARENKEKAERFEREAAELRTRHAPRPSNDIEAQEDARLKDPATTALEKWQIESNRALRANTNAANAALVQAADVRDQTAFAAIAITDPVAKKYQAKVEKELADMRAKGNNAPREAIYTYLLGKDMREGKFKKKAAATPDPKGKTVDRGRTPGARSDVSGRPGALSNRDKLAKKLEGVQI